MYPIVQGYNLHSMVERVQELLRRTWQSLGCAGRWGVGLAVFCTLVVGLAGGTTAAGWTLFGFWVGGNVILSLHAVVRSLVRPALGAVVSKEALGWSLAGAFLSALLTPVWVSSAAAREGSVAIGSALLLLLAGLSFGTALIAGVLMGLVAAGLGASACESRGREAARWGVLVFWGWQGIVLLGVAAGVPIPLLLTLWFGTPCWTVLTVRWVCHSPALPAWGSHWRSWLYRRLVVRRGRRTIDLRGAALGALVGLATWGVWHSGILLPFQANSLIWLMRFRNEPLVQARRSLTYLQESSSAVQDIVLLQFDQQSYARINQRSECAVLAQAIKQLHAWNARMVIVPMPLLKAESSDPLPVQKIAERNRRDMGALVKAVREAGNVVWVVPDRSALRAENAPLVAAGKAVGNLEQVRYVAPALPVLERADSLEPPPLAVYKSLNPRAYAQIQGRFVPTEFYGDQPGEAFVQVPLSSVLNQQAVYWTTQRLAGAESARSADNPVQERFFALQSIPLPRLFENRVVLMPFPLPELYQTPIGRMDAQELIAHQLASLMDGRTGRAMEPWGAGMILIALGVFVGAACLRRAPLAAWWIGLLTVLGVGLFSVALFWFGRLWFDPLLPMLSVMATILLVTQLAFVSESTERERYRDLLQRLVAPEVAEQLMSDIHARLTPGGQRCRVAVLFADVRNFTAFAESHTPEEVIEWLNHALSVLTDALHAHQGILDKYTGDGLMALFASHLLPEPEPDAALICRAVRAAVAMQRGLTTTNTPETPLGVGIGLHFGDAVLGLLGSPHQFNYTAVGQTVVIASRLQTLASAGEVVMSEVVYRTAREAGIVPELVPETAQLKGVATPLMVYRLRVVPAEPAGGEASLLLPTPSTRSSSEKLPEKR